MNTRSALSSRSSACVRSLLTAGCLALLGAAGCAPESVSEPSAEAAAAGMTPAPSAEVAQTPADGAFASLAGEKFNAVAFEDAVKELGFSYRPGVAVLPAIAAHDAAEMQQKVHAVVASSLFGAREVVAGESEPCVGGDGACMRGFVQAAARFDEALATLTRPLARQVARYGADARYTVWKVTRDGVTSDYALTIQGRINDHLVGVVIFR